MTGIAEEYRGIAIGIVGLITGIISSTVCLV